MSRATITAFSFIAIGIAGLIGDAAAVRMAPPRSITAATLSNHRQKSNLEDEAPKPVYVANSYDGNPLGTSPWLSSTKLILLPKCYSETKIFETLDAVTGERTPMERFNDEFKNKEVSFNPWEVSLSPDGRWLAFPAGTKVAPTWVVMTVNGKNRQEWPRHTSSDGSDGKGAWMSDSDHWVEFSGRPQFGSACYATVYSLSSSDVSEHKVIPPPGVALLPIFPNAQFIFTTDGHAYMQDCAAFDTDTGAAQVNYIELIPGPDDWRLEKSSQLIQPTPNLSVKGPNELMLSPDGNWIVWRNNSNSKTEPAQLVISHSDGSDAQEVFRSTTLFWDFAWSPDGQSITFYWDGDGGIANEPRGGGLYTLSVSRAIAKAEPLTLDSPLKRTAGLFPIGTDRDARASSNLKADAAVAF